MTSHITIPIDWQQPEGVQVERLAVTTAEAAQLLACSPKTICRMVAMGKLRRLPYGNYAVAELRRFAREESR